MNVVEAVREAWIRGAEEAVADAPGYVTYEDWSRAFHLRERLTERLLAERLREPRESVRRVDVPPLPDAVPLNESVRAAWRIFHGSPRPLRERSAVHVRSGPRRRPMRMLVEDQRFDHLLPG